MQTPVRSPTQVSPLPDVEHSAPGRHVEAGHHREALLREHEDQDRLQVCLLDITGINVHVHTITPVGYAIDPRVYPRAATWSNDPGDLSVRPVDLWIDITFLYQFAHAKKAAKKADMG